MAAPAPYTEKPVWVRNLEVALVCMIVAFLLATGIVLALSLGG